MKHKFSKILGVGLTLALLTTMLLTATPVAAADIHVADGESIQAAIDSASVGDTIIVSDGIYTEDLLIAVDNLTLKSVNGRDATIIHSAGSINDIVLVTAVGVTIDGFTISGTSVAGVNGIDLRNGGFTIQNNKFVDIYYDNIMVGQSGDIISGTITENTFTGMGTAAGRGAIWVESYDANIEGITISNNIISGYGATDLSTITVAQTLGGTVSDITVTGNSVTDGTYGLSLWNGGVATLTMDTISVTDNTFSRCVIGIRSWEAVDQDPTKVTITGNDITDNTEDGILIESWAATNAINNNNITGNAHYGIENLTGVEVDATSNWWGTTDGAAIAGMVSDNVDYSNWLQSSYPLTGDTEVGGDIPAVTLVTPAYGDIDTSFGVSITGEFLIDATAVDFGAGTSVSGFDVVSANEITATLSIDATATAGPRNVTVTFPEGPLAVSGLFAVNTSFTLAAPSDIDLGNMLPGTIVHKQSTTNGIVITNAPSWSVHAADLKELNPGFMVTAGGLKLDGPLGIGANDVDYLAADVGITYNETTHAPKELPFYVSQAVAVADPAGSYAITITFTGTY